MNEHITRERLQPSLLDRLTDDDPGQTQEPRDKRVLGMRALRRALLRDLGWLFNATGLAAVQPLDDYPLAARSVLNFGFPELSGKTASGLDMELMAVRLRQAIWDFEPRILRDSVQVRAWTGAAAGGSPNEVLFEVHGQLWGQPLPERLYLKTELNLESGQVRVSDTDAAAG